MNLLNNRNEIGQNEAEALELLSQGRNYMEGRGVTQDPAKAVLLYHKALGCWEDPQVDFEVGRCHYFGIGVEKDMEQAMFFLERSAGQYPAAADFLMRHYWGKGVMIPALHYGQAALQAYPDLRPSLEGLSSGAAEGRLSSAACLETIQKHPLYAQAGSIYHFAVDLLASLQNTGSMLLDYNINQYLNIYAKAPMKLWDDAGLWTTVAMQLADGSDELSLKPSPDLALNAACIALAFSYPPGEEMPVPRLRRSEVTPELNLALDRIQRGSFSQEYVDILCRYAQGGNYYATAELLFLSGYLQSEQGNGQLRQWQLKEQGCPLVSGSLLLLAAAAIRDRDPAVCLALARICIGKTQGDIALSDPLIGRLLGGVFLTVSEQLYSALIEEGNLEASFRLGMDLYMGICDHVQRYSSHLMYGVNKGYGPSILKVVPDLSAAKVLGTASMFDGFAVDFSLKELAKSLPVNFYERNKLIQDLQDNERLQRKLERDEAAARRAKAAQTVQGGGWSQRQDEKERRWGLLYDGMPITAEERGWLSAFTGNMQGVEDYALYKTLVRDAAEEKAVRKEAQELADEAEREKRDRLEKQREKFQNGGDLNTTIFSGPKEIHSLFSSNLVGISLHWINTLRDHAFDYQQANEEYMESINGKGRGLEFRKEDVRRVARMNAARLGHKLALYETGHIRQAAKLWHPQAMLRYYLEHPDEALGRTMLYRAAYVENRDAQFEQAKLWIRLRENLDWAIQCLTVFAQEGLHAAQVFLSDCYLRGIGVQQNNAEALRWMGRAAEQGNLSAFYGMGRYCEQGVGMPANAQEAIRWYECAARENWKDAVYRLAQIYREGTLAARSYLQTLNYCVQGICLGDERCTKIFESLTASDAGDLDQHYSGMHKKTLSKFFRLPKAENLAFERIQKDYQATGKITYSEDLRVAAEGGFADAQEALAAVYLTDKGIKPDFYQAFVLYTKAAQQGSVTALEQLAWWFDSGVKGFDNRELSLCYAQLAAKRGGAIFVDMKPETASKSPKAMFDTGLEYQHSDPAKAFYWFERSAQAGHADGQFITGYYYDCGKGVPQDQKMAVRWYEKAAGQGHAAAMCNLAISYANGEGVERNVEEAFRWYERSAQAGHADAQLRTGYLYETGEGTEQNMEKAAYWYRKAAEQGNAQAMYNLGLCYENGKGTEKNAEEAFRWFERSAQAGDPDAQLITGYYYDCGKGVPQDQKMAIRWYEKAAGQGNAAAMRNLAISYANGEGVEKNAEEAFRWYERSAQAGNPDAQLKTGYRYETGEGTEQNMEKAAYWYRKAAEQGNAAAMCNLAWFFDAGNGLPQDLQQALQWYQKAAEAGNARAMYNLGICYVNGRGTDQNDEEAFRWLERSAQAGHASGQYETGYSYAYARGTEKNPEKAVYWYQKAAENGNRNAMNSLGVCYKNGRGIVQDLKQAAYWYQKAAEKGNMTAMCNLGNLLLEGQGVEKNPRAAAEWFKKAADQNFARGKYLLGKCLLDGNGVETDREAAITLLREAAGQDYKPAQEFLDGLNADGSQNTGTEK